MAARLLHNLFLWLLYNLDQQTRSILHAGTDKDGCSLQYRAQSIPQITYITYADRPYSTPSRLTDNNPYTDNPNIGTDLQLNSGCESPLPIDCNIGSLPTITCSLALHLRGGCGSDVTNREAKRNTEAKRYRVPPLQVT
ncbi:hypothetical protein C8R45DRAFT_933638 [Mycena sanguinolenta]|nr:hypothetical protein C8R45DRAFT_933638 [Mycena sanguinolenta]